MENLKIRPSTDPITLLSNKMSIEEKVKTLIVRSRRQMKNKNDCSVFDRIIKENIKYICKNFDNRWKLSIIDTYADSEMLHTRTAALVITSLIHQEKIFRTLFVNFNMFKEVFSRNHVQFMGGIYALDLYKDDAPIAYFIRLSRVLNDAPVIRDLYRSIVKNTPRGDTMFDFLATQFSDENVDLYRSFFDRSLKGMINYSEWNELKKKGFEKFRDDYLEGV